MHRSVPPIALLAALLIAPRVAHADHRPTTFLLPSLVASPTPHPPCAGARRDANRAIIATGGIAFSVTYALSATLGAISLHPPEESHWVREDAWWLVPGTGGFIAGIHQLALGYPRAPAVIAIGAAFGLMQSSGVYLMVEGIRRFSRPTRTHAGAVVLPTVSFGANGDPTLGLVGSF